jgi:4-amino-4-deoxy-L-arabinose transferase-like glycosyltransferase
MHRLAPLLPIALACVLFGWGLGSLPFYTKGEPREGLVVWDMVHAGNWVLPLRNGTEIPSKPPLFHWLGALGSLTAGRVDELTIRLPSMVLAVLGVALTYFAGARAWGRSTGCMAALVLATSFEWVRAATTARVDMTLTFFLLAAFVLAWHVDQARERVPWHAAAFGLLLGLSTLAKGPVGAMLPLLTVVAYALIRRDAGFLRRLHTPAGWALLLLVAGSWYALAVWHGGEAFVTKQLVQENFLRFVATDRGGRGHAHSTFFLVPGLLAGMAPWSLFFPALGVFLVRERHRLHAAHLLYPLVWFLVVFLFYSASSGKRSVYVLPAYPAAALLLAAWWARLDADHPRAEASASARCGAYACIVTIGVCALLFGSLAAGVAPIGLVRRLVSPRDAANVDLVRAVAAGNRLPLAIVAALEMAAAIAMIRALRRQSWSTLFAGSVTGVAAALLMVQGAYHPALAAAHTFKPFMKRVRSTVGHEALYFYGVRDYGAIYYAHRHIPAFPGPDLAHTRGPVFLLAQRQDWKALDPAMRAGFRVLERSQGTGPKGDHRLVLVRAESNVAATLPAIGELRMRRDRTHAIAQGHAAADVRAR